MPDLREHANELLSVETWATMQGPLDPETMRNVCKIHAAVQALDAAQAEIECLARDYNVIREAHDRRMAEIEQQTDEVSTLYRSLAELVRLAERLPPIENYDLGVTWGGRLLDARAALVRCRTPAAPLAVTQQEKTP